MKSIYSKLAVGILALVIGIWIGDGFRPLTSVFDKSQKPLTEDSVPAPPLAEMDGQMQLRFLKFTQAKDLYADFEIINGTDYPIIYTGYRNYLEDTENDKNNFCELVTKQTDQWNFIETGNCFGKMRYGLLTLEPGDRAVFSVAKWDVKTAMNLPDAKPEITTQVGFKIYTGKNREKRILWSDEIKFPATSF